MTARARPILFSAPMVRALLAGKKTQTRRIVKPQPPIGTGALRDIPHENRWWAAYAEKDSVGTTYRPLGSDQQHDWRCPYGMAGDLLWVRETFAHAEGETLYAADCSDAELAEERKLRREFPGLSAEYPGGRWKPSIHMLRSLSRLTLRITEVRVERLHEISEADAIAEGICYVGKTVNEIDMWAQFAAIEKSSAGLCADVKYIGRTAVQAYERLWESINGPNSWAANPWVWALSFEVITRNVDHVLAAA